MTSLSSFVDGILFFTVCNSWLFVLSVFRLYFSVSVSAMSVGHSRMCLPSDIYSESRTDWDILQVGLVEFLILRLDAALVHRWR